MKLTALIVACYRSGEIHLAKARALLAKANHALTPAQINRLLGSH